MTSVGHTGPEIMQAYNRDGEQIPKIERIMVRFACKLVTKQYFVNLITQKYINWNRNDKDGISRLAYDQVQFVELQIDVRLP